MYAIYQINHVVFGVGDTPEAAVADASEWMDSDPECVDVRDAVDGDLVLIPCTVELSRRVSTDGGDIRCRITNGTLEPY